MTQLMAAASAEWAQACATCDVSFTHQPITTNKPGPVTFIVRRKNSALALASAFFPSWSPKDRYLNLGDGAIAGAVDTQGVIRHELGHILGYEHENYRNPSTVSGCGFVNARLTPLTEYDPESVMHHFCGEDDATRFTITQLDSIGQRLLYGPAGP
jgi:hypothetical protein